MYLSVEYTWTSDVQRIHRFTDDIQLYISYDPAVSDELENVKQLLIQCISNITAWKLIHKLKLNNDKTEFMVMQSPHNVRVYGIPSLEPPGRILQSTDAARNLGCYFDRHMQLDRLISSYCSSAYYHIRPTTIQTPSMSAELGRTTYQPTYSRLRMAISPGLPQLCGSVLRAHTRFTISARDTTLLKVTI